MNAPINALSQNDSLRTKTNHVLHKNYAKHAQNQANSDDFEQSISQIASSFLREKAPSLLDYQVGFQIIDKNEDNTKAVGITGFKVGPLWLYSPVFFDGDTGEVKGHELLYIKNQDLFVPLTENWLNYLLNRRPHVLGKPVSKNLKELGVMPPNIYQLKYPPSKYASEKSALGMVEEPEEEKKTKRPLYKNPWLLGGAGLAAGALLGKYGPDAYSAVVSALKGTPSMTEEQAERLTALQGPAGENALLSGVGGMAGSLGMIPVPWSGANELPDSAVNAMPDTLSGRLDKMGAPKLASWVPQFLPHLAKAMLTDSNKQPDGYDLLSFLKKGGAPACLGLISLLRDYPVLMDGIDKFYGQDKMAELMSEVGEEERKKRSPLYPRTNEVESGVRIRNILPEMHGNTEAHTEPGDLMPKAGSLRIIHFRQYSFGKSVLPESVELGKEDREKLLQNKVVIKDERPDKYVTKVQKIQFPERLFNPSTSGLYDVVVYPNQVAKCAVFVGPYTAGGIRNVALVVRLDDKTWLTTHSSRIWANKEYTKSECREWLDTLPKVDDDESMRNVVLISPSGVQATLPFNSYKENSDGKFCTYEGHFSSHAKSEGEYSLKRPILTETEPLKQRREYPDKVVVTGYPGQKFRAVNGELYVPSGTYVLDLNRNPVCGCGVDSEPPPMLTLSNLPELHLDIIKHAGVPTKVTWNGSTYQIDESGQFQPEDAVVHLVQDLGLREKVAREVLDEVKGAKTCTFYLKYAQPDNYTPLQRDVPSAPGFPEAPYGSQPTLNDTVPVLNPLEWSSPVLGSGAAFLNRDRYDARIPPASPNIGLTGGDSGVGDNMQAATGAASMGQKEIFDTSVIGALVKNLRPESAISTNLGSLLKGTDRVGRLLINLYANRGAWEDKYGKNELPALEDLMKDVFEDGGDLFLSLHEKEVGSRFNEGILPQLGSDTDTEAMS